MKSRRRTGIVDESDILVDEIVESVLGKLVGKSPKDFEKTVDKYLDALNSADKLLEPIRDSAKDPKSKVIVTGLHQDLFQIMDDHRKWIERLKRVEKGQSS